MKGLFITFEGNDGAGKSTQMRFLSEYLIEKGYSVVTTREPGGCPISEHIREILLDSNHSEMCARTELFLYLAARAQHVRDVIRPAVQEGKIVLCDRFLDSSLAYQGIARGLGYETVWKLNSLACEGMMPDKTFFLQITAEDAFRRMNENKVHDRLEQEGSAFHNAVYNGFLEVIRRQKERIVVIDASGTKYDTRDLIREKMDQVIQEAGR